METKNVVIYLDDEEEILKRAKHLFSQIAVGLELITCSTKEDFKVLIAKHALNIKALIFDLMGPKPDSKDFEEDESEFLELIEKNYAAFNVPIFIYSGVIENLKNRFNQNGTVYKVSKDDDIETIFTKIQHLFDTGFIDVFCPGGILESEIKDELHKSFTNQFSKNEHIEEVISSILPLFEGGSKADRVKTVFKRIAIKTLASDLLAPIADSEDKVNPIEHFYKRQSKLDIWTGDIWQNKEDKSNVIVLTPRCDFALKSSEYIIYCAIQQPPKIETKGKPEDVEKRLRDYLTDNIQGKAKRYIPSTVFFPQGGMVNLSLHYTIAKKDFLNEYEYTITLSDDLTNEIIGKFAYYFLRTGITNISEKEFESIIKAINLAQDAPK
jgi:hypothetical protein